MPDRPLHTRTAADADPTPGVRGIGEMVAALATGSLASYVLWLRERPDVDFWLHLRIGDFLRRGGVFGLPDPLTALADRPYRPTSWLAEVAMDALWSAGGMPAIQLARLLAVVALMVLVWCGARVRGTELPAAATTGALLFVSSLGWGERPQILGLCLLAATSARWSAALSTKRAPWELLPLFWLWACVHGTWTVGLLVGAATLVVGLVDEHLSRALARRWVAVQVGCLAAVCLTPLGPTLVRDVAQVAATLRGRVNEWNHPTLGNPLWILFLAVGLVVLLVVTGRGQWGRVAVVVVLLGAGSSAVRMLAPAAIVLAPIAAEAISPTGSRARRTVGVGRGLTSRLLWLPGLVAVVPLVAVGGWSALLRPHPEPVSPPISHALSTMPEGTRVIAQADITGWVLWRHPDLALLRDLRGEIYSPRVADPYDRAFSGADTAAYFRSQQVGAALLDVGSQASTNLGAAGWTRAASDDRLVLWVRP